MELEAQINEIQIGKCAAVAAKAQKEVDITKFEAGKLSRVVSKLQRRLGRLEDLRSNGSDQLPPLESGTDDSRGPGPYPGRSSRRTEAPRSDHAPSTRGSARRSDPMHPRRSGEEERDKWLSADYHRRCDPLRTLLEPKRPRHNPEPAPPAYGRYGWLQDEVPKEDTEWDLDLPDEDPMEDLGFSPTRGSASWRRREEEEYMEGVRRGVPGVAYMEEPRRGHLDFEEEMHVAAVGTHRGRWWKPFLTLRPAFMISKAVGAAVWEDLKDIRPSMYEWKPLKLDRFLEKLDNSGMTITEHMDPAAADKYVFKRFRWRLPEVLQGLYFLAAKEGNLTTLKEAKKSFNEQERVDAPQVAAQGVESHQASA